MATKRRDNALDGNMALSYFLTEFVTISLIDRVDIRRSNYEYVQKIGLSSSNVPLPINYVTNGNVFLRFSFQIPELERHEAGTSGRHLERLAECLTASAGIFDELEALLEQVVDFGTYGVLQPAELRSPAHFEIGRHGERVTNRAAPRGHERRRALREIVVDDDAGKWLAIAIADSE